MPEPFLRLPTRERRDILGMAARELGRAPRVLEKDVWVCWCLRLLFGLELREDLAFKGGTSLSKVYGAIDRFSEDIDVTLTYRSQVTDEELAAVDSNAQRKKLAERIRQGTIDRVAAEVLPPLRVSLQEEVDVGGSVELVAGGEGVRVRYPTALEESGPAYLTEGVLLEFGGRNVASPAEEHVARADIAPLFPVLEFPESSVRVLAPQRTFWEKLTLLHAELGRGAAKNVSERRSRHLYDIAMLLETDIGTTALADRELLADVVRIKKTLFYTAWADYDACLTGGFRVRPTGDQEIRLRADYGKMLAAGMIQGTPPDFDQILARLEELEETLHTG